MDRHIQYQKWKKGDIITYASDINDSKRALLTLGGGS